MAIAFNKKTWKNNKAGKTPIIAGDLNRMEEGISDTVNQVNINTKFIEDTICTPAMRNNIFRGEEIPSLSELVSRIHNNFENLYIGDHCKVQFSSDFLYQNCWDYMEKITADITVAGINTYLGIGYVNPPDKSTTEQREAKHIYMMEPHAVMVLTLPISCFKTLASNHAQTDPTVPLCAGTYNSTVMNNYASSLGTYDSVFRLVRADDLTNYLNMKIWVDTPPTMRESWLYRYVFNSYAYTDNFNYDFPPTNLDGRYTKQSNSGGFSSALQIYDMNDVNYTDYVLEKPDYLPSYYNVLDTSVNSRIPSKLGAYIPYSTATEVGDIQYNNPVMINLGPYNKKDATGLGIDIVLSKFNLLSEEEVFGYNVYGNGLDNGHSRGMLPLFKLAPGYRCFGGLRYWLKNLAYIEPDNVTTSTARGLGAGVHQSVVTSVGMPDVDWWAQPDTVRFYFLLAGGDKCTIKNQTPLSNYEEKGKGGYLISGSEGSAISDYMKMIALGYGVTPPIE